jgi:hypothetical protein
MASGRQNFGKQAKVPQSTFQKFNCLLVKQTDRSFAIIFLDSFKAPVH